MGSGGWASNSVLRILNDNGQILVGWNEIIFFLTSREILVAIHKFTILVFLCFCLISEIRPNIWRVQSSPGRNIHLAFDLKLYF